ncbi:hypothetical protein PPL_09758 [Heterostelium album PN500]|uniref:GST N-terminal domain-containing protein n=1 Tax=Heterostelium pallidum (strain ATCC 26659 / Pp 5 / PN500) TaxID=670386 RepID=D3BNZ6_HETP5|nr:hypothetical protein PPL_09758 [Heterostelium album PN500]EFA77006.1 hypothetical protein PPL_09758 [Heterostelium album PN500]|eukprot:XP_020429136.1 hypothetical protein PPL_09758 [Heterostelium album PN500]
MSSNQIPTLHYFNGRGRAETSRVLLTLANVEFNDVRNTLPFADDGIKQKATYKQLPYYIDGDFEVSQSLAIENYIANKYNLAGDSLTDKAKVLSIQQASYDISIPIFTNDTDEKKELYKNETLPRFLAAWEKILLDNGGKYFVGTRLSAADRELNMSKKKYFLMKGDDYEDEVEYKDDHLDSSTDILLSNNNSSGGSSNKRSDSPVVLHFDHDDDDDEDGDHHNDETQEIDLNEDRNHSSNNHSNNNNNNNMTIINFSDNNDPFSANSTLQTSSTPYSTSLSNWRNIIRNYRIVNNNNNNNSNNTNTNATNTTTSTYSTPTATTTTTTTPTTPPTTTTTNSHFPFPTPARWENSHLKDKDTIIIKQPNGRISLGLNEKKFYHHLRTGEHDPNGLYMGLADPDILLQHYNQNGNNSNQNDIYINEFDGFIHSGNFESYRRKKFLISLITCEIFYSALLMAEVLSFNPAMLMLILVIICNIIGLFSLTRNKTRIFNVFLMFNVLTIIGQILIKMFTPLFLLRLLTLMIGIRVRHEMILDYINNKLTYYN